MFNEEKDNVKIYVINSNTGHVVRSEDILTSESLITVAKRYATKDSIVVTSISDIFYCFYIKRKVYLCDTTANMELINYFKDVIDGLYDNARDSFHITYGRVATLCESINTVDHSKYDAILTCIDDIWETRYYSRFLRRGKND
jgi:hypothetical protein